MPLAATPPVHASAFDPPVFVQAAPGEIVQISFTGVPVVTNAALAEIATLIGAAPARARTTGPPGEVTVRLPSRSPAAVGAKVTVMAQIAFGASVVPQLLVCAKSPEVAMPSRMSRVGPTLVNVSV